MKVVDIQFDLYCKWAKAPPSYRLYCDNDLLTERTYTFDNRKAFVRELSKVELPVGEYEFVLENLHPELGTFDIRNIWIAGKETNSLKFTVT
jgi:hypothetical protein